MPLSVGSDYSWIIGVLLAGLLAFFPSFQSVVFVLLSSRIAACFSIFCLLYSSSLALELNGYD